MVQVEAAHEAVAVDCEAIEQCPASLLSGKVPGTVSAAGRLLSARVPSRYISP